MMFKLTNDNIGTSRREMFEKFAEDKVSLDEKRRVENIDVNRIALRKENKFIIKEETLRPLIKSIEENGLIEPILICSFENYLAANNCILKNDFGGLKSKMADGRKYLNRAIAYLKEHNLETMDEVADEIFDESIEDNRKESFGKALKPIVTGRTLDQLNSYLELIDEYEEKYNNGFYYFIISGHRRFKAYLSLLVGKNVVTDSDWEKVREEKLRDPSEEIKKSNWFKIPSYILTADDVSAESEATMYSDSNTTQRELTSFEIIINTIDEMKANGEWDRICAETVKEVVDGLSQKAVYNLVQKLKKDEQRKNDIEQIENEYVTNAEKKETAIKEYLKKLPIELVPKTEAILNNKIARYIDDKKKRTIKIKTIDATRRIYKNFNQEFLQLVFDGIITTKEAQTLVSTIQNMDENEKETLINQIKSGNYDFSKKNIRIEKMESSIKSSINKQILAVSKEINKISKINKEDLSSKDIESIKKIIAQLEELID